jgi:hypothetical protein
MVAGMAQLVDGPDEAVGAALTVLCALSTKPRTLSSRKRGFASVRSTQSCLRGSGTAPAPRSASSNSSARGRQGIDPELAVVRFAAPDVLVLGVVVDEQQKARRGQALDEGVEEGLGLTIDPVQIFKYKE